MLLQQSFIIKIDVVPFKNRETPLKVLKIKICVIERDKGDKLATMPAASPLLHLFSVEYSSNYRCFSNY